MSDTCQTRALRELTVQAQDRLLKASFFLEADKPLLDAVEAAFAELRQPVPMALERSYDAPVYQAVADVAAQSPLGLYAKAALLAATGGLPAVLAESLAGDVTILQPRDPAAWAREALL